MATKIGEQTILNERIEVQVNGAGRFEATFDEVDYNAPTMEELREKLTKAVKKSKAQGAVPVTIIGLQFREKRAGRYDTDLTEDGPGLVHAMLRGKHERNNEYLLTSIVDGKEGPKFKVRSYGGATGKFCKRLTAAAEATYRELSQAVVDAEAALEAFRQGHHVDPDKLLADAMKKGGE